MTYTAVYFYHTSTKKLQNLKFHHVQMFSDNRHLDTGCNATLLPPTVVDHSVQCLLFARKTFSVQKRRMSRKKLPRKSRKPLSMTWLRVVMRCQRPSMRWQRSIISTLSHHREMTYSQLV